VPNRERAGLAAWNRFFPPRSFEEYIGKPAVYFTRSFLAALSGLCKAFGFSGGDMAANQDVTKVASGRKKAKWYVRTGLMI